MKSLTLYFATLIILLHTHYHVRAHETRDVTTIMRKIRTRIKTDLSRADSSIARGNTSLMQCYFNPEYQHPEPDRTSIRNHYANSAIPELERALSREQRQQCSYRGFYLAAIYGNAALMGLFIKHGYDVNAIFRSINILKVAQKHQNEETASVLVANGADDGSTTLYPEFIRLDY